MNSTKTKMNGTIPSQLEKYYAMLLLSNKIISYCLFVVLAIGIIGNLVSLLIFTRQNLNKKTNTGTLYSSLCILNIVTIIEAIFLGSYTNLLFGYTITYPCYLDVFISRSLYQILSWNQVLICFDRFILVIYPIKASKMQKKVFLG